MTTYIAKGTFAEQGISNIKDSPTRVNDARVAIKKMGGELKARARSFRIMKLP
ncbi:MAG: hypothetical protein ACXADB_07185 [Candidatus Hermodarchaeia archaeon]|jgi:uncharacterized protein with GYD domain